MLVGAPANALFRYAYDLLDAGLLEQASLPVATAALVASALASAPACAVKTPAENVKQRLQTRAAGADDDDDDDAGADGRAAARSPLRRAGLYAGFQPQLAREVAFNAVQFTVHDSLVGGVASLGARAAWVDAASGGVAAAAAAVVTQPLDVIKTRQMAARRGAEGGLVLTGTAILRDEGARALFLGTAPRVALVGIGGAAYFWADRAMRVLLLR